MRHLPQQGGYWLHQSQPAEPQASVYSRTTHDFLRATYLEIPVLCTVELMDIEWLHNNILSTLPSDSIAQVWSSDKTNSRWSVNEAGFLHLNNYICIPDSDNLHLQVLQSKHDHPLAGHFSQNRTLGLIHHKYTWPGLRFFVKDYIQSCTSCAQAKIPHHGSYRLLKQLPVPEKP